MSCEITTFNGPRLSSPALQQTLSTLEFTEIPLEYTIVDLAGGGKRVQIQVAEPGYWLIRGWMSTEPEVDAATTIQLPENFPYPVSFLKVTDANGLCNIDITSPNPGAWYVHACLCGPASVSSAIVIGI